MRVMITADEADTVVDVPTADLRTTHFAEVPLRGPFGAYRSLLSLAHAAEPIGHISRHSWRDQGKA